MVAPSAARAALRPLVGEPDDLIAEDVLLSASELVTNVILHTGGGGELRAWDPEPHVPLRIEVEDHDPRMPHALPAARPGPGGGGRGLMLVACVSDAWGVLTTDLGKLVWAEFDRDRRS